MGSPDSIPPPLLIRADAHAAIGNGHAMRCLVLGAAFREQGAPAVLLGRIESPGLRRRIEAAGIELRLLPLPHPDPSDLGATLAALGGLGQPGGPRPWTVLDGYHFDPAYQRALRAGGWPLMVLDDIVDRPRYHADIVLNQNLGAERLSYPADPDTTVLAGSRYVLLRRQFLERRGAPRDFPSESRRILVTLGGGDPENATATVLRALDLMGRRDLSVTVAVGSNNPHLPALRALAASLPWPVRLEVDAEDMPALMEEADLAISAAGSTTWELAFLGVPSILLVLAENQTGIAREMGRAGAAVDLGWLLEAGTEGVARAVSALAADRERRRALSARGRALVDGEGVRRITEALRSFPAAVRPAAG